MTRGIVRAETRHVAGGYAYILRCADGRYYYGSTDNLIRRLAQHGRGDVRSTCWRLPASLVFFEEFQTLDQARQRERSFKGGRTRRKAIERLIAKLKRGRS